MNMLNYREGKERIQSIPKKGAVMGSCATLNRKYICCGVHVLRSVQNCPFECTYCFLQNYLNDGITKAVHDFDMLMEEVRNNLCAEPGRLFRIGTWELGDSLALEEVTGQAARLIHEFSRLENAVLELKTKSDRVEPILPLDHGGRTVVSWSLNPEAVIRGEEFRTASLEDRLHALHRTARAGYLTGLHFDPMILYDGWEEGYEKLVHKVFEAVSADTVAWISIGSLRFNPEMKKKIENNYPGTSLTSAEMVLGDDAKMRYVKPLRVNMYRQMFRSVREHVTEENLVYLCMERWDVWDKVFGSHPGSIEELDHIFAESLYRRFGLGRSPQPFLSHSTALR